MNAKERRQEEQELQKAVSALGAAIRSIAQRKARRYEQEFLIRVRDMIDREIGTRAEVSEPMADIIAHEVKNEIMKD